MAPGRKRGGAKGKAKNSSLNLGDLVLAKVKGFPAWPAKISSPEDHNKVPDPRKYFVLFFGTKEIAFVAPADIQPFTSQVKDKLLHKCKGKTVKQFSQAVKEICEIFDGNDGQTSQPDANSTEIVDEEMTTDGPSGETSSNDNVNQGPGLERCSHAKREMGYQEEHPNISRIVNDRSPPVTEEQVELSNDDVTFTSDTGHKTAFQTSHTEHTVTGNSDDVIRRSSSHGSKNEVNVGVVSPDSGGISKKAKKPLKDKTHVGGSDSLLKAAEGREQNSVEPTGKKRRSEPELGKDNLLNNAVSHPTKRPKGLGDAPKKSQAYRKNDVSKKAGNEDDKRSTPSLNTKNRLPSRAQSNGLDSGVPRKAVNDEDKQSTPNMKPKAQLPSKVQTDGLYGRAHGDEDVLPPAKRRRREPMSDDRIAESSIPAKKADTVKSVTQAPMKRRAVRICDDDEDEPKTPVHGRSTSKGVDGGSHTSMSVQENVVVTETVQDSPGMRNRSVPVKGVVANSQQLVESEKKSSQEAMKALVSPSKSVLDSEKKSSQEVMKALVSPSKSVLDSEKKSSLEVMKALVSPSKSPFDAHYQMVEPLKGNKTLGMVSGNVSQMKGQSGSLKTSAGIHDSGHRSQNNAVNERSRPVISGDKPRSTPKSTAISTAKFNSKSTPKSASKSTSRVIDTAAVLRNPSDSSLLSSERLEILGVDKTTVLADSRSAEATKSMKHLIAVAQAKRKQAQSQNHAHDSLTLSHMTATEATGKSPGSFSGIKVQTDGQFESNDQSDPADIEERRTSSGHRPVGGSLSGGTEAAVARDTFEGMIETLSRAKDSIGRATRHAIDCAKQGIANEVVELLIQKLENESSLHRKVDLLFLVDSITQCSHSQKGIAGASYIPIVQTALPRLLGAAAPPGANARENRRQCVKVLNLWLERKILPDTLLRGYIEDMGTSNDDASAGISSKRPSRSERAVDDPLREMEGMLVDEYGSNATFQLPGLLSSHVFEDEEEDDIFNFSLKKHTDKPTLELNPSTGEIETCSVTSNDRRHCILEDVDGELEMEDVSGHSKDEKIFPSGSSYNTLQEDQEFDRTMDTSSDNSIEASPLRPSSPPLPPGSPPRTPPLPSSPPPPLSPIVPPPPSTPSPPPPPPPPPPMPLPPSQTYPPHRPTAGSPQVLFLQPPTPQNVHPYQSPMPSNVRLNFYFDDNMLLPREVPLNTRLGAHVDPAVRGEMFPQQPSGFNSSRTVDYGHETYTNPQGSLSNQQFQTANVSLPPRAFQPTMLPQTAAGQFQYPNPGMRPSYSSMYGLTKPPDGPRRYVADEQWRPPSNEFGSDSQRGAWIGSGRSSLTSGPPFAHEDFNIKEQPSLDINLSLLSDELPLRITYQGHSGSLMVPCRPDLSSLNTWRPS
ncbi:enhancer of AG-4 protein 2 isoform X1 [Tanacetum coccineum]|uniref:Enhancer of AG-4 protein 2 isoform X1 n=1 Tax=Tanacetum coccineum TaxID=301880 RepID=A0ABQ5AXL8_9ASTR